MEEELNMMEAPIEGEMDGEVSGDFVSPMEKSRMDDMMAEIEQKRRENNSQRIVSGQNFDDERKKVINEIFDVLEENGVDPSNPEDMAAFFDKMKESDPENFEAFRKAILSIFSKSEDIGSEMPIGEESPEGQMPMDIGEGMPSMPMEEGAPVSPSGFGSLRNSVKSSMPEEEEIL